MFGPGAVVSAHDTTLCAVVFTQGAKCSRAVFSTEVQPLGALRMRGTANCQHSHLLDHLFLLLLYPLHMVQKL